MVNFRIRAKVCNFEFVLFQKRPGHHQHVPHLQMLARVKLRCQALHIRCRCRACQLLTTVTTSCRQCQLLSILTLRCHQAAFHTREHSTFPRRLQVRISNFFKVPENLIGFSQVVTTTVHTQAHTVSRSNRVDTPILSTPNSLKIQTNPTVSKHINFGCISNFCQESSKAQIFLF